MHLLFSNLSKAFFKIFFNSENKNEIYFISTKSQDEISDLVEKTIFPNTILRKPRSLKFKGYFKSSENRIWIFYCYKYFESYLDSTFFKVFENFILNLKKLCKWELKVNDIKSIDLSIRKSMIYFQKIFGV